MQELNAVQDLTDDIHRDLDAYREAAQRWLQHEVIADIESVRQLQRSIHDRLRRCVNAPQNARVLKVAGYGTEGLAWKEPQDIVRVCDLPSGTVNVVYRPSENTLYFWRG